MAYTLADKVVHEETVQRSRFIAKAAPVASEEEALAFLAANREPHNCFAYKLGHLYRFSHDGEPLRCPSWRWRRCAFWCLSPRWAGCTGSYAPAPLR